MAIKDMKAKLEAKLENAAKKRRYDQANQDREDKVKLTAAQAKCRGELEKSKSDFEMTIRQQSKAIREGEALDVDTSIQEQMLFDAAVGYLLVREAIFSLRSINTHQSISQAYGLMDLATRQMSGKKSGLPLKSIRNRSIFGYATSEEAYQKKCDQVSGFYEELKDTGDIAHCMELSRKSSEKKEQEEPVHYTRPDRDEEPVEETPPTEKTGFTYRGDPMRRGMDYGQPE